MRKIGITTTVPVEMLIAAGYRPVDLNNVLVNDRDPEHLITIAERAGFPLNCCSWIKGIYGVCLEYGIDTVLGVTTGDCSNTAMLMEVLRLRGIDTITFAYPDRPDPALVRAALRDLAQVLDTTLTAAETVAAELRGCRDAARQLDELTWKENRVNGGENHLWLVSTSDFNQDYREYYRQLTGVITECRRRLPYPPDLLRLAYIGVPPVYARDLYPFLENNGGHVVFNEVQRQFAMPHGGNSLAEQYARYTYPYSIHERLADITTEAEKRQINGIIHYVQAFCHRGIADVVFREKLDVPILTIEGNNDFFLSSHLKTRLEAFLDMLRRQRRLQHPAARQAAPLTNDYPVRR